MTCETPGKSLRDARETLEKILGSVCLLVCSGDEHIFRAGWDVMGWLCLPHGFATCACCCCLLWLIVVDGCTLWLPTLRATPSNAETNAEVNAESCDVM